MRAEAFPLSVAAALASSSIMMQQGQKLQNSISLVKKVYCQNH